MQEFTFKWEAATSLPWKTANVYTNALSVALRGTGVGCHIYDKIINSLRHADNMALLATTVPVVGNTLPTESEYCSQVELALFRSHNYFLHCNSLW